MSLENIDAILHRLNHYLPSQAPLKEFIHHNTLHAFQEKSFHKALNDVNKIFGYQTYLPLEEYRKLFHAGKIKEEYLYRGLKENEIFKWKQSLLFESFDENVNPEIGQLRSIWKSKYKVDMDSLVFPSLFRITLSYLDQGIAIWQFPVHEDGFLASIRELATNSSSSLFKCARAKRLLLDSNVGLKELLALVVGNPMFYERYLFDQQFAHPGYSGMVSVLENNRHFLVKPRKISLHDFICLELLLEIDALDYRFGEVWSSISNMAGDLIPELTFDFEFDEVKELKRRWQEAYEWSYYDPVLLGIKLNRDFKQQNLQFQAIFCIDDRECSLRRYVELINPNSETFGTAGFFNLAFYFQPAHSELRIKVCPASITPSILIKEEWDVHDDQKEFHFNKQVNGLFSGWLLTQSFGLWSGFKLIRSMFFPKSNKPAISSGRHMYADSTLQYEFQGSFSADELQIGFTVEEMASCLHGLLMSIGLTAHFAPMVYIVGHGSSSTNNTHYAGYDCGACSGRPGSVNARIMAKIANRSDVREILKNKGICIPETTWFVAALHDTCRDELSYFDVNAIPSTHLGFFKQQTKQFEDALTLNAAERSRRFMNMSIKNPAKAIDKVQLRALSLFEPRPELNHATNAVCIVGRRNLTRGLFLDRRSFLNSYDYRIDPNGHYLSGIMNAIAPVCGGINLEYFFSRMDNHNLGAGTKLPHNVMGLIGVANGIDGDLRTGLPNQMIEVHDPIRLLAIVEHFPFVVMDVLKKNPKTMEWFDNQWIHLIVLHPREKQYYRLKDGELYLYKPMNQAIEADDLNIHELMQQEHNANVKLIKTLAL